MPKNLPGHCYGKVALPRPSPDHFSPIYQIKKKEGWGSFKNRRDCR